MSSATVEFNATTGVTITPPVNKEIASRKRNRYSVSANQKLLPNPDVVLRKAGKTIEVYRDLLKDAHVASCEQSRKSGVFALEWEIVQGGTPVEIADFVRKQFENLDLEQIIGEILDAPLFGYSVLEVMWQYDYRGYVVATDVTGKPQEWFKFDDQGSLYLTSSNYIDGELMPDKKFLVARHRPTYLNPYGESVLSRCYWPVTFKKQLLTYMLVFAEKYGMPWLIAYYDQTMGISNDALNTLLSDLDGLHSDGVGAFSSNNKVEILDTAKQATVDVFMNGVVFFNAEVSKAILSQTLTTEQGATGSYAMSQTHLMVRKDVVDADKRLVERTLNTLVRWIVDINWMDVEAYPKFRLYEQEDVDQALVDRDAKLYGMGVRFGADYIAEAYGIDAKHITIVDPNAQPAGGPAPFARRRIINPDGTEPAAAPSVQLDGTRRLSEEISKLAPDDSELNESLNALLQPVIDQITAGRSYEEVRESLIETFGEMDSTKIEETLAHAMFMADLVGRVSTR